MKQTKEKKTRSVLNGVIILIIAIVVVLTLLVVVFMPFIIDMIYECPPPKEFFDVELSKSDILDYYAQFLSLLATIVLGVIAVIQTYRSQKKSDEINELQLSIAQRELAVVEKQYVDEVESVKALAPKFEVKLVGYNGSYCNIKLEIKNASQLMISSFRFISFEVQREIGEVLNITRWKIRFQSLGSSEIKPVEVFTPDMRDNLENMRKVTYWENVKFVWKFSCEDYNGNRHFYAASIEIPTTKEYIGDFWKVIKIG